MKPIVLSGRRNDPRRALQILAIILLNILVIAMLPGARDGAYPHPVQSRLPGRGSPADPDQAEKLGLSERPGGWDLRPQTRDAVIWFQKKNGLVADGIAGPATLKAMGIFTSSGGTGGSGSSSGHSTSDYNLLARLISAEARGEPYSGQVAVGAVVLNRMRHPSFPDTLSGVIYQKGAFSCLYDGQFDQPVAESAFRAAQDALNGWDPSGGAIYYYNPKTATNQWIRSRPVITTIGRHVFCS